MFSVKLRHFFFKVKTMFFLWSVTALWIRCGVDNFSFLVLRSSAIPWHDWWRTHTLIYISVYNDIYIFTEFRMRRFLRELTFTQHKTKRQITFKYAQFPPQQMNQLRESKPLPTSLNSRSINTNWVSLECQACPLLLCPVLCI